MRGQRAAVAACGVLAWLLASDALFRIEPPDPTDWKLAELARQIVPRLDGATAPLRILVVPNDEQMNFTSLDYALLRATRAKTQVERSDRTLDAAKLATYDLAVVVVPPPDEAPYSQGSRAAAELVLSRPEWVEEARFAHAYSFKYSSRPGTPASTMDEQVPEEVKRERLDRLQAAIEAGYARFNGAFVGKTMPVLFEKAGRYPGQLVGRSPYLQLVHADADASRIGEIVNVEIQEARSNSLAGVICP